MHRLYVMHLQSHCSCIKYNMYTHTHTWTQAHTRTYIATYSPLFLANKKVIKSQSNNSPTHCPWPINRSSSHSQITDTHTHVHVATHHCPCPVQRSSSQSNDQNLIICFIHSKLYIIYCTYVFFLSCHNKIYQ